MSEITIPEGAYPALQKLARLSPEDFSTFLAALERAKPAATPNLFSQHVAEHAPQMSSSTIRLIVDELFNMNYSFEDLAMSIDEMAKEVSEAAFEEQSEEFPITEADRDILKERLAKLLVLKASLGLTSKASGLLTDADRLFYNARILTDVRPIFNEEGNTVEATVIMHNLVVHYGENGDHKDFFVVLDTHDIKTLREVLDRADSKAKALELLLKRSEVSYLGMEK
jgi:uncharacterized protein (DUF1778 family)